jgi:hypothetical protein
MKQSIFELSVVVAVFLTLGVRSYGQPIPEEFKSGTISEQFNQLEAHTRIYDNYRAIREDIFQLVFKNIKDTLVIKSGKINKLSEEVSALSLRLDTTQKKLESTKSSLEDMTRTKNSMRLLGVELNKHVYNTSMWSILGIITLLLIIGFLIFRNNRATTLTTKTELDDLKNQFDEYKQKKRIEIEKLTMTHFNEIQKLKNNPLKR